MAVEIHKTPSSHLPSCLPAPFLIPTLWLLMPFSTSRLESPLCGYLVNSPSGPGGPANPRCVARKRFKCRAISKFKTFCALTSLLDQGPQAGIKFRRLSDSNASSNGCHLHMMQKIAPKMLRTNIHMFLNTWKQIFKATTLHHVVELGSPLPFPSRPLSISKTFCSLRWKSKLSICHQPSFAPLQLRGRYSGLKTSVLAHTRLLYAITLMVEMFSISSKKT